MRQIIPFALFLLFFSCTKDEDTSSTTTDTSQSVSIDSKNNLIQKGPFIEGSSITLQELNDDLTLKGRIFTTETLDDFGSFDINTELESDKIDIAATGFYFNEVTGELSDAQLTLHTFIEFDNELKTNINILSTIGRKRIKYLIVNEELSYQDAKTQAEKEILLAFNITESLQEGINDFNTLDISQDGNGNAVLLAISVILQANNSVAELSELISKITNDIETDGTIDNTALKNRIIQNNMSVDSESIAQNLKNRFEEINITYSLPPFENYIDSDGDGIVNLYDTALIAPLDTITNSLPEFSWSKSEIPDASYQFQLSKVASFENLLIDENTITENTVNPNLTLENNQEYFWRVKTIDENGDEQPWNTGTFKLIIGDVNLISPLSTTINQSRPTFIWEAIDMDNISYQLQIASDSDFNTVLLDQAELTETSYTSTITLPENNTSYYWRVRFIDKNGTESDWTNSEFTFQLGNIDLISPIFQTINNSKPTFTWEATTINNVTYQIQLSDSTEFDNLLFDTSELTGTSFISPIILPESFKEYYWRVRFIDKNGAPNEWVSSQFYFALDPVTIISPIFETIYDAKPTFNWEPAELLDNVTYQIQIASDSNYNTIVFDENDITETSFTSSIPLPENNKEYYWRVRYKDQNGALCDWANSSFTFQLKIISLNSPVLETINQSKPVFNWDAIAGENISYRIQLAKDIDFTDLLFDETEVTTTLISPTVLPENNTTYSWRVKYIIDNQVESDWNSSDFTFELGNINLVSPILETINNSIPTFTWNAITLDNITYQLQIATDEDFNNIIEDKNELTDSSFTYATTLPEDNTSYYWRVRFIDQNEFKSEWTSSYFTFKIGSIQILFPENTTPIITTFNWESLNTPTDITYDLQIANNEDFSNIIYDQVNIQETSITPNMDFHINNTYYWRIRFRDGNNFYSKWFENYFTYEVRAPFLYDPQFDDFELYKFTVLNDLGLYNDLYLNNGVKFHIQASFDPYFNILEKDLTDLELQSLYDIWNVETDGFGTIFIRARHINYEGISSDWSNTIVAEVEEIKVVETINNSRSLKPEILWTHFGNLPSNNYSYKIQFFEDPNLTELVEEKDQIPLGFAQHRSTTILNPNTTYYYKVSLNDNSGDEIASYQSEITPKIPEIVDGVYNSSSNTFDVSYYSTLPTSLEYEFQLATDSSFTNIVQEKKDHLDVNGDESMINLSIPNTSNLTSGVVYYWRVRLLEFGISGEWSTSYDLVLDE